MQPSGKKTRRVTIGGLALFVVLAAVFTAGEALSDPGGWRGAGLVALWAVPLVTLGVLAWWRPGPTSRVLGGGVIGVAAMDIWAAFGPRQWASFERGLGPVRAVVTFALAGVLTVLAIKLTTRAGWMLVAVGGLPLVLGVLRPGGTSAPLGLLSLPLTVAGVLLLTSTRPAPTSSRRAPLAPGAATGRTRPRRRAA
jgi:hypothetical protein